MTDRTPLKFEYDDTTPSSLAEYTASDTVPIANGGTGVSSLLGMGAVSATTVSAGNFYTPDGGAYNCMGADGESFYMKRENGATYENLIKSDEGTITIQSEDDIHFLSNAGEKFMRLNESGGDGEVELYFNNTLKLETNNAGVAITPNASVSGGYGFVVSSCPVPNPFGYIQLTADDSLSADEKRVGYSNTPTSMVSDSTHIQWNDGVKQFDVSAAGIYEVVYRLTFEGGASLVTIKIQRSGSAMNTSTPRVHSTVDPVERTMSAIFACASGDCIFVTYDATSSNTVKTIIGSTVTVKRIQ